MVREIDAVELQQRLQAGEDMHIVDIRTHGELASGCLPEAGHIPMHLVPLRMGELPKDRDVVLYCRSGARSYHACLFLGRQGFRNVYNLREGIVGWARNGFALQPSLAA